MFANAINKAYFNFINTIAFSRKDSSSLKNDLTNNSENLLNLSFMKPQINFFVNFLNSFNLFSANLIIIIISGFLIITILLILNSILSFFFKPLQIVYQNYIFFFITSLEKEITNLNIFIKLFGVFLMFLVINNFGILFNNAFAIIWALNFQFFLILVVCIVLMPINLIYMYSVYFLAYIRGASLKKNLIFESLIDCLNLISYFLRINIQFIRIMLINAMFFTYEESYYELIYPWYNTSYLDINNCYSITDYFNFGLNYLIIYFFQWLYELAHFWVIFFMQSTVFSLIVTLLILFLHTLYVIKHIQRFFNKKI